MRIRVAPLAAALATLATLPATCIADVLQTPAPGARNLTAGGGWHAWAAPAGASSWRLVVRAPDGTVTHPPIAGFGSAPDPSIGSDRFAAVPRRLLVVYSRCRGNSDRTACDVYGYHLNGADGEQPVAALATKAYSETAPSVASGRYAFVRRGGAPRHRLGVHFWSAGAGAGSGTSAAPRRISPQIASETATNASRVAFPYASRSGPRLAIKRLSGDGPTLSAPSGDRGSLPRSIVLERYRATWLAGAQAFQTPRLRDSAPGGVLSVLTGDRALPAGTNSIVGNGDRVVRAMTAQGVTALVPLIRLR